MRDVAGMRAFLARILGWSDTSAVERALAAVTLAATGCTALVLCGEGDLVPIAWALHRRIREPGRPFIVADPRRGNMPASVRSPESRETLASAREVAQGGTLCLSLRRPPTDLAAPLMPLHAAEDVMLILCASKLPSKPPGSAFALRPAPVIVPPLSGRAADLPRIVDECAAEAAAELGAGELTAADREWVLQHAATSLDEIDKATRRIVAVRGAATTAAAATRLGMSDVSLSRWLDRRGGIGEI